MKRIQRVRGAPPRVDRLEPRRLMVGPPNYGITLVGRVFDDLDGDGKWDRNEPPVAGVTISGSSLAFPTGDDGKFNVFGIGNVAFCQIVPPEGMHFTPGESGHRVAERTKNGARHRTVHVRPVALTRTAGIAGTVFHDADRDGTRNEIEPSGVPGRRVLLDLDADGVRDPGERVARTDRTGAFGFGGLDPGAYRVHLLRRPGWDVTTAGDTDVVVTTGQVTEGVLIGVARRGP